MYGPGVVQLRRLGRPNSPRCGDVLRPSPRLHGMSRRTDSPGSTVVGRTDVAMSGKSGAPAAYIRYGLPPVPEKLAAKIKYLTFKISLQQSSVETETSCLYTITDHFHFHTHYGIHVSNYVIKLTITATYYWFMSQRLLEHSLGIIIIDVLHHTTCI